MLTPDKRVFRSSRAVVPILVVGLAMLVMNTLFALTGTSGSWYSAITGFGLALMALSDMLLGRGARRAVVVLRAEALLGFSCVFVGFVLEATGRSSIAVFAIIFGLACAALAFVVGKARDGSRQP